jgi:hypothetical protein
MNGMLYNIGNHWLYRAILISAIIVLSSLALTGIYRRYTGLTRWQSALLCLLAAGVPIAFILVCPTLHRDTPTLPANPAISAFSAIFLSLLAAPYAVRLYRKWIGGNLTDAEKLPGMDGVRAWLSVGNLICAVLVPICAWQAFQVSLPAMFALTFGLLLAYPVFNLVSATPSPAPAMPPEDLSNEREKVLQLLEAGKITADESAELLNALGHSVPPRPQPASEMDMTPQRKIVLLGAALLLLSFFLPWFKVNLGQAMHEAAGQMQQMMGGMMPGNGMTQLNIPQNTGAVQIVQAGNIPHGLGWWILALGIGAAVLPFFATTLKAGMQKKVILAALTVGAFLLVYLVSDTLRYISVGVILALAGYALEIVGTLKERTAIR